MASNNFINWVLAIVVLLLFFGIIANSNDEITGRNIEIPKGDGSCTTDSDCEECTQFCGSDGYCQSHTPERVICDIDNSCREAGSCPDCLSDSDCLTCTETCDQGSCLPSGKEICHDDSCQENCPTFNECGCAFYEDLGDIILSNGCAGLDEQQCSSGTCRGYFRGEGNALDLPCIERYS